jgi:TonB family protein
VHARLEAAAIACYPAAARRFRQTGTTTIAFCVGADRTGTPPMIRESSGFALLDSATACVVERAAPFPPEAAGQCFTVPVRFGK